MTKVQLLIKEISELEKTEFDLLLDVILKRANQEKSIQAELKKFKGIGKGIWDVDAQDYISTQRQLDRV